MKIQPDFFPKKHLGQHFLIDPHVTEKIISACQLKPDDVVLEIGPGLGVLTHRIAPLVKRVIAVETDRKLCEKLAQEIAYSRSHLKTSKGMSFPNVLIGNPDEAVIGPPIKTFGGDSFKISSNIEVVHADFLKYNFDLLPEKLKVIGNLPYYISSPIMTRLLNDRKYFSAIFITVQLEFGQRLCAKVDTKDYSALSCFVQYFADVKMLFKIKNAAFKPIPKVDSCFMRIIPHEKFPFKADEEDFLFKVIHQSFQQRRKTLPNTLSGLIERERLYPILESLKIDPKSRPENLSVKNFVEISNALQ